MIAMGGGHRHYNVGGGVEASLREAIRSSRGSPAAH